MSFEEDYPEFGFSEEQAQRFVNKMSQSPELTMMFNMWRSCRIDKQRVKEAIEKCTVSEMDAREMYCGWIYVEQLLKYLGLEEE